MVIDFGLLYCLYMFDEFEVNVEEYSRMFQNPHETKIFTLNIWTS